MSHHAHVYVANNALRPQVEARGRVDAQAVPACADHRCRATAVVLKVELPPPEIEVSDNLRVIWLADDVECQPFACIQLDDLLVECDSACKDAPACSAKEVPFGSRLHRRRQPDSPNPLVTPRCVIVE